MKKFGILACLVFAIPNLFPGQATALDPINVLKLPVVKSVPADDPNAILLRPTVADCNAACPTAVLNEPTLSAPPVSTLNA